jgi:ABC-type antimicrobial peptide transport system permease subunit
MLVLTVFDIITQAIIMLIKIIIVGVMLAIVFSLFRALYFLTTEKNDSKKMVNMLSWRIGLSIFLFIILMLAIAMGWIEPGGLPIVDSNP